MSDLEGAESQHDTLNDSTGHGNRKSTDKTNKTPINKYIRTLAEAIQAPRREVSKLKRKAEVDLSESAGHRPQKNRHIR